MWRLLESEIPGSEAKPQAVPLWCSLGKGNAVGKREGCTLVLCNERIWRGDEEGNPDFSCFGKMLLTSVFAQQLWACVTIYVVLMIVSFSLIHLNINCFHMKSVLVSQPFYPLSSCPGRSFGDRNIWTAWSLWRSTSEPTLTSRKATRPLAVLRARLVTPSHPLLLALHPLGRSTAQMTCERGTFIMSRIQVTVYTHIHFIHVGNGLIILQCEQNRAWTVWDAVVITCRVSSRKVQRWGHVLKFYSHYV